MEKTAVLVVSPHPLLPLKNRQIFCAAFLPDETIANYMIRQAVSIPSHCPCVLTLDGLVIPPSCWAWVKPKSGHLLVLRGTVEGGRGGKTVASMVLTAAVFVAAPYLAPAMGVAAGLSTTLFTAGVRLAGAVVVSAIFAPQSPAGIRERAMGGSAQSLFQASHNGAMMTSGSPSYSITGAGNRMRLFEPMPLVFGRHRLYPDNGALPYTQCEGDDEYLYQVLHVGLSDVVLSDLRLGNTPLSAYHDIQTEQSDANGKLTLFPIHETVTLGEGLTASEEGEGGVKRTSPLHTTGLRVEFAGDLYTANTTTGATENADITLRIRYRAVGSDTWCPFTGDNEGHVTISHASRQSFRRSYFLSVASGQYDVWVQKTSPDTVPFNVVSRIEWTQLLSMIPDETDYANQTRFAIRMKASEQLHGTIDSFNAIASARIPVWDGSKEVLKESSNPAYEFLAFARGKCDANGRRLFGAGLADTHIDLAGLREWGAWCDQHQLACNMVIDNVMTVMDVLTTIARCGRASPSWASGQLGVVVDRPDQPIIQVFGMANIKQGSFRMDYLTDNLADEIHVSFIHPELDWKPDTVRVMVPGTTQPKRPVTVELLGITSLAQAGREANLLAARQYYHQRRISWETDAEGFVCNRGDVVSLAHDLTQWAYSGRLLSGTATVLHLDRLLPVSLKKADQPLFLLLRYPDNTLVTREITDITAVVPSDEFTSSPDSSPDPLPESSVATVSTVSNLSTLSTHYIILKEPLPSSPDRDPNNAAVDYLWFIEPAKTPGKKVKIVEVNPVDETAVQLVAMDEIPEYYTAEYGAFTHVTPERYHGESASVSDIHFAEDLLTTTGLVQLHIRWKKIAAIGVYCSVQVNTSPAEAVGLIQGNHYSLTVLGGQTVTVTLRPEALIKWRETALPQTATYVVQGLTIPPANVNGLTVTRHEAMLHFRWRKNSAIDIAYYKIKKGETWATAMPVIETHHSDATHLSGEAGTYLIKAINLAGKESPLAQAVQVGALAHVNYVLQHDEALRGWQGSHDHTVQQNGVLELAHQGSWADFAAPWETHQTPWAMMDAIALSGTYITETLDLGWTLEGRVEVNVVLDQQMMTPPWEKQPQPWASYHQPWAGLSNAIDLTIDMDTRDDHSDWAGFRPYVGGDVTARYYRFRLTLTTRDAAYQPLVTACRIAVDVPDRTVRFHHEPIPKAGKTLTFAPFHIVPTVSLTLQHSEVGDTYRIVEKSTTQVTLALYNAHGQPIEGEVDCVLMGY